MAVFVPSKTLDLAEDVSPTPPTRNGQALAWDATAGLYRPGTPFAPVYNVLDYGVTGNGTTDDQPALQALVNRVLPVAYGGTQPPGVIFFPPGIYKLGATLDLTHACALTLRGCGTNHPTNPSYLSWTGASGVGIRGDSSSGLQLRNLRIQADNPACPGDLISFAYSTNDSNGIVIADCFLGGSDAAQPLRALVSMHGTSGAVIRGNVFNFGQRALRLGIDNYNIATTVEGSNMFVGQSVYSIDFAHTENLTIRSNIFEGGPDLAQHALRARSPLNYGVCIKGNWAGDSVNPPGGVLLDLQDILGLDITGANRFSSSDTLMKLDAIMGGRISGNVFDSLGALYLFAGTQSSGLQIAGNYAATSQALYQGPLPTYSYLEGTGYTWDAGAKTVRIGGSTTPAVELNDGTNLGNIKFNGGQLEISNNGGGLSISPAGGVGLDLVATQKLGVNGNLGFFGYDWRIGNDTNMGWGIESSSAGGQFFVGVAHAGAAQADPSLHGFRVRDSYLDSTNFLVDGNSAATWCLKSSTTGGRAAGRVIPGWVTATDAVRTGRLRIVAGDWTGTDRELIRLESDGSAGRLSFFASTAVVRQSGDVGAALSAYGLVTSPSYAAASLTGTIAVAQLPVFVGSGAAHAPGAVPDPGASAGTTRFLREDATWAPVPASGPTIGTAVSGGGANRILYENGSQNLAASGNLTYNTDLHLASGNMYVDKTASNTTSSPAIMGFSGPAGVCRHQYDDTNSGIQSGFGQGLQVYAWHGISLEGLRTATAPAFAGQRTGQHILILLSQASTRGLAIQGAAAQAAPLLAFTGVSSTSAVRDQAFLDAVWATATDASRKGRLVASAADASGTSREGWRVESDGTQALLSFFGGAAVARPILAYSRSGAGETAAGAAQRQALAALGLVTDSTTP